MSKQKEWVCSKGCDLSRVACEHLEALLPSMRDKKLVRADVANHSLDVFQVYRPSFDLNEFVQLMRKFGFVEDWDLELLTAKYYYEMSNEAIQEEQSYTSRFVVARRLKHLQAQLKERGFKPRSRK